MSAVPLKRQLHFVRPYFARHHPPPRPSRLPALTLRRRRSVHPHNQRAPACKTTAAPCDGCSCGKAGLSESVWPLHQVRVSRRPSRPCSPSPAAQSPDPLPPAPPSYLPSPSSRPPALRRLRHPLVALLVRVHVRALPADRRARVQGRALRGRFGPLRRLQVRLPPSPSIAHSSSSGPHADPIAASFLSFRSAAARPPSRSRPFLPRPASRPARHTPRHDHPSRPRLPVLRSPQIYAAFP